MLRYGISTGRCERNPAPDLHGALKPIQTKHMAAFLEPAQVATLMRSIYGYQGQLETKTALILAALLFQRPTGRGFPLPGLWFPALPAEHGTVLELRP